jgi:hypothetical protein
MAVGPVPMAPAGESDLFTVFTPNHSSQINIAVSPRRVSKRKRLLSCKVRARRPQPHFLLHTLLTEDSCYSRYPLSVSLILTY